MSNRTALVPGILLLIAIAVLARIVGMVVSFNHLLGAIVLGAIVGNSVGVPARFAPGVKSYNLWLEIGIVLLGAQLIIGELFTTGPLIVGLVFVVLVVVLSITEFIGRKRGLGVRMRSLLGAGIGICGVSAVVAVAEGVRARQEEIAYAVTTILVFDAATLMIYPFVGAILNLDAMTFGIWTGLTMFSTGPVAAVGFSHSADAGTWAVVTKLVRNSLLGFVVIWFSIRVSNRRSEQGNPVVQIWQSLPKFVIGFFLLSGLASLEVFSSAQRTSLEHASQWAFLIAFVGLGFDLRIDEMKGSSITPLAVTAIVFIMVSVATLISLLLLL